MSKTVAMLGAFDDLRSRDVRLLEEASKFGQVTALVFGDDTIFKKTGKNPKFPLAERLYLLTALRFVSAAVPVDDTGCLGKLPGLTSLGTMAWVDAEGAFNEQRRR